MENVDSHPHHSTQKKMQGSVIDTQYTGKFAEEDSIQDLNKQTDENKQTGAQTEPDAKKTQLNINLPTLDDINPRHSQAQSEEKIVTEPPITIATLAQQLVPPSRKDKKSKLI